MKISDDEVNIAFDVGLHAGQQAMEAIARAVMTVPAELSNPTTITAHAFLLAKIKLIGEQLERVTPGYTQAVEDGAVSMELALREGFQKHAEKARKRLGIKTTAERDAQG
jgi:hypothetical protein